ncbi:MAG TPA: hypothetical protein VMZ25_06475 [Terriglobales bacterium]|nr:hypothetical protein [Terriglobales bacterium]
MRAEKGRNKMPHRINLDGFFADVICDAQTVPATWHCIVQPQGGKQILFWSQETSRQGALQSAQEALHDLKMNAENAGQLLATIGQKKFMTLRETMQRLRSRQ